MELAVCITVYISIVLTTFSQVWRGISLNNVGAKVTLVGGKRLVSRQAIRHIYE